MNFISEPSHQFNLKINGLGERKECRVDISAIQNKCLTSKKKSICQFMVWACVLTLILLQNLYYLTQAFSKKVLIVYFYELQA